MPSRTLVNDKKYIGKYVAIVSFNDRKIIASGKDPITVCEKAEQKGFADPLIIYVQPHDVVNIY